MTEDFIWIETGGSDRFNLSNLDYIRCPDCNKDNLVKVQEKDVYICRTCGLALPESQLSEAVTLIPDTSQGVNAFDKPYFNQTQQNKKARNEVLAGGGRLPSIIPMEESNQEILKKYTLRGLGEAQIEKDQGIQYSQRGQRVKAPTNPETQRSIKTMIRKLFPLNAQDIKIDLQ